MQENSDKHSKIVKICDNYIIQEYMYISIRYVKAKS